MIISPSRSLDDHLDIIGQVGVHLAEIEASEGQREIFRSVCAGRLIRKIVFPLLKM